MLSESCTNSHLIADLTPCVEINSILIGLWLCLVCHLSLEGTHAVVETYSLFFENRISVELYHPTKYNRSIPQVLVTHLLVLCSEKLS
jgi:hypothetical protein